MISPEHQRAITDAIPAGVEVPDEFWRDLDSAITLYRARHERRTAKPPMDERKRWLRIEKLVDKLGAELRAARRGLSWEHSDPLWPNRALVALWGFRHFVESHRIGYEMIGAGFKRRANPHQALLCAAVCNLWMIHLGQELTYSPGGPLPRFFDACLYPVLGFDMPTDRAIRDIIARHKAA